MKMLKYAVSILVLTLIACNKSQNNSISDIVIPDSIIVSDKNTNKPSGTFLHAEDEYHGIKEWKHRNELPQIKLDTMFRFDKCFDQMSVVDEAGKSQPGLPLPK